MQAYVVSASVERASSQPDAAPTVALSISVFDLSRSFAVRVRVLLLCSIKLTAAISSYDSVFFQSARAAPQSPGLSICSGDQMVSVVLHGS